MGLGLSVRPLSAAELGSYGGRRLQEGYRFSIAFPDGKDRRLDVLRRQDDPFAIPLIALVDRPGRLEWPHIESDGVICLVTEADAVVIDDLDAVVKNLLSSACVLVHSCIDGSAQEDFRSEAASYWSLGEGANATFAIGATSPAGASREIAAFKFVGHWVFADTADQLVSWIRNRSGDAKRKVEVEKAILLALPQAPMPQEFPRSAKDAYELVGFYAPELLGILERNAREGPHSRICLVISAPTPNGWFVGAVTIPPPPLKTAGKDRKVSALLDGFRPSRMPRDIFLGRFFSGHKAARTSVERADPSWVHGRDVNPDVERLAQCQVTILGCGSLGSGIAKLLAQSGVGSLVLVDYDTVSAPNASRHILGVSDVGRLKTIALKEGLQKDLPHLQVSAINQRFENLSDLEIKKVLSSTIVVSAMGASRPELYLNRIARTRSESTPPIIYAWMEAHAVAAHAVLIEPKGPCLKCGLDGSGIPLFQAAEWPNGNPIVRQAACGQFFQPYGAIDLQNAVSLVAELCVSSLLGRPEHIHKVRVVSAEKLRSVSGIWTDSWAAQIGSPDGEVTIQRRWLQADSCIENHG